MKMSSQIMNLIQPVKVIRKYVYREVDAICLNICVQRSVLKAMSIENSPCKVSRQ